MGEIMGGKSKPIIGIPIYDEHTNQIKWVQEKKLGLSAQNRDQIVLAINQLRNDYDGFQDCEAPDLETWSKAVNAGQYPFSVLGMNSRASEIYVTGIYGNTMTTNPRALETASAFLTS